MASALAENETNSTKAQTFGTCVADAAYAKNDCFTEAKAQGLECKNAAGDKEALKLCAQTYKQDKKECKMEFKQAKMECKKLKHNALDAVGAAFRKGKTRGVAEDVAGDAISIRKGKTQI
ncbi:MAG TPA: hypothetical protein VEC16_05810 [Alphaproteobacteria bacterium]|nr:hypothetical protein [Alphaproteobacteria bacterium]